MRALLGAHSSDRPSTACVIGICLAEMLGLAGYSIVSALLPQIMEAWSLDATQGGWLAGIIFAGYMIGVVPLVAATDRIPARTVFLASAALSVISSFGIAFSEAFAPALFFRALTGLGLAGMYMPGLRALTDGIDGARRARVAALYTSSFHRRHRPLLPPRQSGHSLGWRTAFMAAAIAGLVSLGLAWTMLPRTRLKAPPVGAFFPLRAVLENRNAMILIVAYSATIWGAVGLRQWVVVFLGFCAGDPTQTDWSMLAVAALINLLGVPAGLWGNELAIRFGLRLTTVLVFVVTAIVTSLFGGAALLPFAAAALVALAAGFIAQGNFSNLTSGLLAVRRTALRGGNHGALFVHRLWRWVFRHGFVRVHAQQFRRRRSPRRVDRRLRHIGNGMPHRRRGNGASVEGRRTPGLIRRGKHRSRGACPVPPIFARQEYRFTKP